MAMSKNDDNIVRFDHPTDPVGLLKIAERYCSTTNKKVVAGHVVLMTDDGSLWYDGCGKERQAVLWALESVKMRILAEGQGE